MPIEQRAESLTTGIVLRCALALAAILLFYTSIDMYALMAWSAPPPVWWVIGCVVAAAALVIVNPHRRMPFLRSPLALWAGFFFLSTTVWALWMDSNPRVAQAIIDRYRSIALLVAAGVIFDDSRAHRVGQYGVAAAVVFASCVNVAELLGAIEFNTSGEGLFRVGGRAGGFYVNPNDAGMAIVFGLAVSVAALPRAWRVPMLLVGGVGVAATFSRGAAMCFAALLTSLLWQKVIRTSALALTVVVAVLGVHQGVVVSLESHGVLNENATARINLDADDSGRGDVALKALKLFLEHPLVGSGLGATRTWDAPVSSHDTYLNLAADQGVLGLLTFPLLLLALVARNRRAAPLALVLLVAGVFSDGLIDQQRFTLVLVALGAAARVSSGEVEPEPLVMRHSSAA